MVRYLLFKYILVFFIVFLWFILTDCIDGRWGPDKQQRYKEGGCDKGGCHLQTHYLCMRSGFSCGGSWGEECMYGMCKRAAGALLRVRRTTPISAVMFSISSLLALSLQRVLALFFSVLSALSSRSDLLSWLWLTKALSLLHSFSLTHLHSLKCCARLGKNARAERENQTRVSQR